MLRFYQGIVSVNGCILSEFLVHYSSILVCLWYTLKVSWCVSGTLLKYLDVSLIHYSRILVVWVDYFKYFGVFMMQYSKYFGVFVVQYSTTLV